MNTTFQQAKRQFEKQGMHGLYTPAEIAAVFAQVKKLRDALAPFANFACDPPCSCHNCTAKALVDEVDGQ